MSEPSLLVAIVDDEESVRRALQRLLRSAGVDTVTYASGVEFLSSVAKPAPDCVVLDLHMAHLSGFEVMELLPPSFPVIAITGHDSPEAQARASRAAFYLRKPVNDLALIEAVTSACAPSLSSQSQPSVVFPPP